MAKKSPRPSRSRVAKKSSRVARGDHTVAHDRPHAPQSYGAGRVREDYGESRRDDVGYSPAHQYGHVYPGGYPQPGQTAPAGLPQGHSTFVKRSDEEIEDHLYHDLDHDLSLPAELDVDIEVSDGVVTLTGNVRNKRVKQAAGDYAWRCPGVRDVHNNIRLVERGRRAAAAGGRTPAIEQGGDDTSTAIGQEGDTNS